MDILDFFPEHLTPRPEQIKLLRGIQDAWRKHSVICVTAPTAVGKTALQITIARWVAAQDKTANIIPHTNVGVEQYQESYPALQTLHKKSVYKCGDGLDCDTYYRRYGRHARTCQYNAAKRATKKSKIRLINPWIYMAHKLWANTLIFDEGHTLVDMLAQYRSIKLWQSQYDLPDDIEQVADVISWIERHLKRYPDDYQLGFMRRDILRIQDSAIVEYREAMNRGRLDRALCVRSLSPESVPGFLWPQGKVQKIVLMSATLSEYDVRELNLHRRSVAYLGCDSPIPADRRPFVCEPALNMSLKNRAESVPQLAAYIAEKLALHPDKGIIHAPYAIAQQLRALLDDPRLLFHNRTTKRSAVQEFKSSAPDSGRVLVASGLYEGLDLPYDLARWQIISAVPFLSLGDEVVKAKMESDPDGYAWEAIKRIVQAAGRPVRAVDDYAISYMPDSNFIRLFKDDNKRDTKLFPKFFRDTVKFRSAGKT